jgi:type I restriction enzyme S subunit
MERFELPKGWEWRSIDSLCDVLIGGTPRRDTVSFWGGPHPWVAISDLNQEVITKTREGITDLGVAKSSVKLIKEGTLLLSFKLSIGKMAFAGMPLYTNEALAGLPIRAGVKLIPKFLYFALRTIAVGNGATEASKGRTLNKEKIKALEIPVPPLPEQQRLVARIEALTSRGEVMSKAQQELVTELRSLLAGYYAEICVDAEWKPLAEVAPQVRRPVVVQAGESYLELGIRSFGKGTFHKPAIAAEQLGSKRIYHIHPGDVIFNNVFGWEGAVAVVKAEDAGRVGSHRFITCVPKINVATAPFLYFHFTTEQGLHDLGDASPGGAGRNRTLGLTALSKIQVPVPDYDKQVLFARLWEKVEITRGLRVELAADLLAFVPALLEKVFRGEL